MSGSLVLLFYIVILQHKGTTKPYPLIVQRGLARSTNNDKVPLCWNCIADHRVLPRSGWGIVSLD